MALTEQRIQEMRAKYNIGQPEEAPTKSEGGIFSTVGSFLKDAARPIVKTAVTGLAPIQDTANLALGNEEALFRSKVGYNVPGYGWVKPARIGKDIEITKDTSGKETKTGGGFGKETLETVGIGAQIAPYFMGVGTLKNVASGVGKVPLKSLAMTGLRQGAAEGSIGGFGVGLADEEATPSGVVGSTVAGGLIGGALGLVSPFASTAIKGVGTKGKSIWRHLMDSPSPAEMSAGKTGNIIEGIIDDVPPPPEGGASVAAVPKGMKTPGMADEVVPSTTENMSHVTPEGAAVPAHKPSSPILRPHPNAVKLSPAIKKEAKNIGFEDRVVDLVDGASPIDREKMRRMVSQARASSKSYLVRERPITIAGESIFERVKHVDAKRKEVGKALDDVVQSLPDEPLDVSIARDTLFQRLADDGTKFTREGGLDFSGTPYKNDASGQKLITQLFEDLYADASEPGLTPKQIRTIRRRLFNDLGLDKRQPVLTDSVTSLLEKTRENLDEPLRGLSDDYRDLSKTYAKSISALRDFYDLMGKKFTYSDDDILNVRAGEVGSRLMGNASADTLRVLDALEGMAQETGRQSDDDILRQIFFADQLNELFNITQPRSFQGGIERGAQKVLEGADIAMDAAKGNVLGVGGKIYAKIKGITPEKQQELLERMLQDTKLQDH